MPAMSKIAVCGGALMAASAFVTPAGPSRLTSGVQLNNCTRTARMQSSLRGTNVEQGKAKSGTSLSGALASMAGLAAVAAVANRPARRSVPAILCSSGIPLVGSEVERDGAGLD
ncbi:unnamed protein product [Durusdinium trenchii]|uniref:Uncharacterized protein n=1 Tax=Durusdinium trenchii TaxID=1381693 RepID=A0ABP0HZH0_9DINO